MSSFFAGKLENGDFAVRLSRFGFDALTETNLGNFLIHEDLENIAPLVSGQVLISGNSTAVVDTGVENTVAPPLIFFFAQRRFVPSEYYQMGGRLYCQNNTPFDFREIRFVNGLNFEIVVSYFVYNRRVGI